MQTKLLYSKQFYIDDEYIKIEQQSLKLRNSSYLLIEMAITRMSLNCIDKFIAHEMSEKNIHVYFAVKQ